MRSPLATGAAALVVVLLGTTMLGGLWAGTSDTTASGAVGTVPADGVARIPIPGWWHPVAQGRPTRHGARFTDFHRAEGTLDGIVLRAPVVRGAGVGRSVLAMRAHTSTHRRDVPHRFPHTNQLSLVRLGRTVHSFAGFTVGATPQGHLYNGLRIDRARRIHVHDVRVAGIPGDDDAPPGETFGLNDYRTAGSRYARIEIDGKGVGGAGFGVNGSRGIVIRRSYSHDNRYSMGYAFFQVKDVSMSRCVAARNGGAGFNFERVSGTVRLAKIVAVGNRYPIRIASDRSSARYTIVDPVFDGPTLQIELPPTYYGHPNRQRGADVRLVVHGRDRSDLLRFTR